MLSYHRGDYVLRIFRNFGEMEKFFKYEPLFFTDSELKIGTEAMEYSFKTGRSALSYLEKLQGVTVRLVSYFQSFELADREIYFYNDYVHDIDYCPPGVKED